MADAIVLRDHSKPCEHDQPTAHYLNVEIDGHGVHKIATADWCPGGKEIILRRQSSSDIDEETWRFGLIDVWVEVDDDE